MMENTSRFAAYNKAQVAIADLKSAIYLLLLDAPDDGLRNADIGRALGIYMGHADHVGHIPRSMLALMQTEGVVAQDVETKRWRLTGFEPIEDNSQNT